MRKIADAIRDIQTFVLAAGFALAALFAIVAFLGDLSGQALIILALLLLVLGLVAVRVAKDLYRTPGAHLPSPTTSELRQLPIEVTAIHERANLLLRIRNKGQAGNFTAEMQDIEGGMPVTTPPHLPYTIRWRDNPSFEYMEIGRGSIAFLLIADLETDYAQLGKEREYQWDGTRKINLRRKTETPSVVEQIKAKNGERITFKLMLTGFNPLVGILGEPRDCHLELNFDSAEGIRFAEVVSMSARLTMHGEVRTSE